MSDNLPAVLQPKGSLLRASAWMFGLGILLFWMPLAGPLIAGLVGGREAGSPGKAALAVFLPGILVSAMMYLFFQFLTALPLIGGIIGMIAGFSVFFLYAFTCGPLLLGALAGALLFDASRQPLRLE